MVEPHGSTVPAGFSASVLFKRMSSSVRPVPAMIRAVDTLQQAGEMENNHSVTTLQEETSQSLQCLNHWRKVSLYRQDITTEMFCPQILPNCKGSP